MKTQIQVVNGTQYSDSLPYQPESVTVLNPTQYTLYLRSGGRDVPANASEATITVPPASNVTWPVNSADYGMQLGQPSILASTPGLVTVATVMFSAGEPVPTYSSMSLSEVTGIGQISQYGTITLNSFTSAGLSGQVPQNTTGILVLCNGVPPRYSISLTDPVTNYKYTNSPTQTRDPVALFPVAVSASNPSVAFFIENDGPATATYTLFAVVGSTPTVVAPLDGSMRVRQSVIAPGTSNYDALTNTGDAGTYRWTVGPATLPERLVIDSAFCQIQVTGTTTLFAAVTLLNASNVEQGMICQAGYAVSGFQTKGPIYVPAGLHIGGFTQNTSGTTQNIVVSCQYHYEVE